MAQDAITFEAVRTVTHGQEEPSITFQPSLASDGERFARTLWNGTWCDARGSR
jgi:hypothetical protein